MRLIDPLVEVWLRVYSDLEESEIAEIVELQKTQPLEAKNLMAKAIVARYHGAAAGQAEQDWFRTTFSERQVPADAENVTLDRAELTVYELVRLLTPAEESNSDVRRLIKQGGVRVDGSLQKEEKAALVFDATPVPVKLGKRRWFQVSAAGTAPLA
jgi:tyrosyl-tRNA synthetase